MRQHTLTRHATAATRAAVHVGTLRLEYWRAGDGPPVLLLQEEAVAPDQLTAWVTALAAKFRVVAPDPAGIQAATGLPPADRLRGFLDGLGLERAHVVTHSALAAEVVRLALSEPDRIACVVILLGPGPVADGVDALLADRFAANGQRLLVVRPGGGNGVHSETLELVLRFLSGD
jgi:pimeloyl-ACP methyl ester carboxylesterase